MSKKNSHFVFNTFLVVSNNRLKSRYFESRLPKHSCLPIAVGQFDKWRFLPYNPEKLEVGSQITEFRAGDEKNYQCFKGIKYSER